MFHENNAFLQSFPFNALFPQGTLQPSGAGGGITVQVGRTPNKFVSGGVGGVKQVATQFTEQFQRKEAIRTIIPSKLAAPFIPRNIPGRIPIPGPRQRPVIGQ